MWNSLILLGTISHGTQIRPHKMLQNTSKSVCSDRLDNGGCVDQNTEGPGPGSLDRMTHLVPMDDAATKGFIVDPPYHTSLDLLTQFSQYQDASK